MTDTSDFPATDPAALRRKRLLFVGGGVVIAVVAWASYAWLWDSHSRTTDDAYVNGHVITVTPQAAGTVIRIGADNADHVTAGTSLVEIDATDARMALAAAQADLARAVRSVRGLFAATAHSEAEIDVALANLDKAREDFEQRQAIAGTGAVTDEDVRHARSATRSAEAIVASARKMHAHALAQTDGTTLESHPEIQAAAERVRVASLALVRARVVAPVNGMVMQRSVQLGRRVAPGDRLMAVVPLDRLWIDANFKETQLDGLCPGQPATVTADVYGKRVIYKGRVADIEAASGAASALLPAQNATGNWIKVVQRVPVRIQLDPAELARSPLRIGLSTKVTIDIGKCDRAAQPAAPHSENFDLYATQEQEAEDTAAGVIAAIIGAQQ